MCPIVAPPPPKDKKYDLAPAQKQMLGVFADVIDLGMVQTAKGPKRRIRFIILFEDKGPSGKHYSTQVTLPFSGHPDSLLSKFGKQIWTRVPPENFNWERAIGVCRIFILEHNRVGANTYANPIAILPPQGHTFKVPPDYKRKCERT